MSLAVRWSLYFRGSYQIMEWRAMCRQQRLQHYEWVSAFLRARGALRAVRFSVAAMAMAMAMAVIILIIEAGGPRTQPAQTMMWLAAGGGVASAVLWLWRWPSRTQSIVFVAVTTGSISLACLAYPDPLAALLGCVAFTAIAGYAAFFHSTRVVLGVFLVITAVALTPTVQLASQGRIALSTVDLFLVLQANIAVAVAIHTLLRTVKRDLAVADLDPLTGLLNRRAFRRQLSAQVSQASPGTYLCIALLDIDNFKLLNDTHGHAAGDHALVTVADALRATVSPTAIVARSGGEEFLVADLLSSSGDIIHYEHLCTTIEKLPVPATVSVGTSWMKLDRLTHQDLGEATNSLIAAADMAMYRAKRNGGNQCHHHDTLP
ncbi:diguanylate cyclase [Mycolicibacterium sp. YH-1]|uniref:GGDEF domain-containing protein n=1 Tax=Mycolicibacterium sp. YH-1 TaxID=2908837 RepID=UPI001F4C4755|nr:GGDEF domain-containing protein [Mycolicibacterium sp. YH-1]UNB54597.1 diguanylate cyclase [Mycolicibacterium sp. YH-1]